MIPVSASELASIQNDLNALLDQSCTIQRSTPTADAWGTQKPTYSTVGTCKVLVSQPSGSQLANYAYLIGDLDTWQVRAPVGTDIREQDHLIIDGQTLIAQVVLQPKSYQGLLTVLAAEVKTS